MDALDRIAAQTAGGTEPVSVPLAGKTLRVKPPMKWKSSAMKALREGNLEDWAATSLVNDEAVDGEGKITGSNDYAVWKQIDPDFEQIVEFMRAYRDSGGMGLGE